MSGDLNIEWFSPVSYRASKNQKIDVYKRISCILTKEEADDMRDELTDRFGAIPRSVENLIDVSLLRTQARDVFVTDIVQKENGIEFRVLNNASYDPEKIAPFIASYKGKLKLAAGVRPYFFYRFSPNEINSVLSTRQTLDISLLLCRDMKTLVADKV